MTTEKFPVTAQSAVTRPHRVNSKIKREQLMAALPFLPALTVDDLARLERDVELRTFSPNMSIRRRGTVADGWLGVVKGLLRIENTSIDGRQTTLTHFSDGCWFGEGTLLKREAWPFDATAATETLVALLPLSTFEHFLEVNVRFNRFLLEQLNARLGQFVERCEHLRLHDADHHVAHCLVEMTDPRLFPSTGDQVPMSQEALARLAGVSRSVVSHTLQRLERQGLLKVDYRSITFLNRSGLRQFSDSREH
jgi:CRP/FNR family cyclic AMP-dependent transcriptional regulator